MRMLTYAKRCAKEILRDPLNIAFGLGFPIVVLLLLSAIQSNVPVDLFRIERLTPGVTVFGLSFITLFSATLISRDKESALLQRLFTTPMRSVDFLLGYMLPLIPIAAAQCVACYIAALILGLQPSINILSAVIMVLPISLFYISLGLLCGSLLNVKQVGGLCGALLTNLSAWLSGVWFDIELLGEPITKIARLLPFIHAVELERKMLSGITDGIIENLVFVLAYSLIICILAVITFLRQMKK